MARDDLYLRKWSDLKEKEPDKRAWLKGKSSILENWFGLKKMNLIRKGVVNLSKYNFIFLLIKKNRLY